MSNSPQMGSFTTHPKSGIVTHSEGGLFLFTCLLLLRQIFAIVESLACDTYIFIHRYAVRQDIDFASKSSCFHFFGTMAKRPQTNPQHPHCIKIRPLPWKSLRRICWLHVLDIFVFIIALWRHFLIFFLF